MPKKTVAGLMVGVFLLFTLVDRTTVVTAAGADWTIVSLEETEPSDVEAETSKPAQKKTGNSFGQALSAPFRALGRLFGGGKKTDQQARRSSPKDRSKFESTKLSRVIDARTPLETPVESTSSASEIAIDVYLQRGRELLTSGDLNGAIAELSIAVSLHAKSGEANNLLGVAYEGKGLRERALESFKAAVQADKNSADYLNNYGFLLFKNNDFDEATKYLKRAAKLSPNDPRIWNNLGLAQCKRGKFDDAFRSFARGGGDFNGHINVAAQLSSQGRAKDAIKHLEKAQALQPESVDVLAKLASLYEMTGRVSDAEATRRSIVALRTFADANK